MLRVAQDVRLRKTQTRLDSTKNQKLMSIGRLSLKVGICTEIVSLYVPREAQGTQCTNSVPVHVEFIPDKTMTRGLRHRVMIVVPSFAER